MNTHTTPCEHHESLQEEHEGILDKALLISRFTIIVLTAALAAICLWTLFSAV